MHVQAGLSCLQAYPSSGRQVGRRNPSNTASQKHVTVEQGKHREDSLWILFVKHTVFDEYACANSIKCYKQKGLVSCVRAIWEPKSSDDGGEGQFFVFSGVAAGCSLPLCFDFHFRNQKPTKILVLTYKFYVYTCKTIMSICNSSENDAVLRCFESVFLVVLGKMMSHRKSLF